MPSGKVFLRGVLARNLYSRTAEGLRKFYTFFSVAWIPLNRALHRKNWQWF